MQGQDSKLQFNLLTLGLAVLLLAWGSFSLLRAQEEAAVMGRFKQDVALQVEKLNQDLAGAPGTDSMQVLIRQKALFEDLSDVQVILWEASQAGSKVLFLQEQPGPLLSAHAIRLPLSAARPDPWVLEVIPGQAYLADKRGLAPYLLTTLLVLISAVLGRIALLANRRCRRMQGQLNALRLDHAHLHAQLEKQTRQLDQAHQRLVQEFQLDPLTGIANRQRFENELDDECRRAVREFTPLTLVRFDLNEMAFSELKHQGRVGEEQFLQLIELLKAQLTRPGDRIALYNESSLVFLLPATNEHASALVERCCAAFADLHPPLDQGIHTGLVTLMPSSALNATYARDQLEMAMQEAHKLGCNRFHHRVEGSEQFPLTYAD